MLQIKEVTEGWKNSSTLGITSFEIHTSAALDYFQITHLPPHDTKDNFKSLKYSITSTTLKRHYLVSMFYWNKAPRREITEAHQLEHVWHQWFATRRRTKPLLPINHPQATNTLYLHFKAAAATLKLSSSSEKNNTYHQWVLPLISLTPSSFHLKCPAMCHSINKRLADRFRFATCKFLWREIQNSPTTILPINP